MLKRSAALLFAVLTLTACNEDGNNADSSGSQKAQTSVIGSLRPKADPAVVEEIKQQRLKEQQEAQAQAMASAQPEGSQQGFFGFGQLPKVETGAISGDPSKYNTTSTIPTSNSPMTTESPPPHIASSSTSSTPQTNSNPFWPFGQQQPAASPPPQQVASYGGYGNSGGSAGLIPPPPAVTLSTQAQTMAPQPYAMPPGQDYNPYAQQQYNPYAYPPPQAVPQQQKLPQGSMFGNAGDANSGGSSAEESKPKKADIQVITPTGMEPRSPYKQRDDLKILFKAALAVNSLAGPTCRDQKIAQDAAKIDVGLPSESTKGSAAIGQRQIDMLYKGTIADKRIVPTVKKVQTEITQAYYRFLYSFNKYSLAQQTVAARKQEVSVAESNSEKQRAAADLAKAQEEADSTKDDLRSAQNDLAGIAGAPAARSVIQRVSGVAPSLESLAQAEPQNTTPESGTSKVMNSVSGWIGNMGGMIGLGGKKPQSANGDTADGENQKVAKAKPEKSEKPDKNKDKDKKGKGVKAPQEAIAARPADAPKPAAQPAEEPDQKPATSPQQGGSVAFQLKEVQTTPRKSVLRVAIRNNGDEQFTFDPDVVSVAEGDRKLAEAAVRAEFDTTVVAPNSEVVGTITIFGRPWNDKLKVSLSEGGRTIQLHR